MNEDYTITAKRQYRQVYQGTQYTIQWTGDDGVLHTAKSWNLASLQRFARNGFTKTALRGYHRITVVR